MNSNDPFNQASQNYGYNPNPNFNQFNLNDPFNNAQAQFYNMQQQQYMMSQQQGGNAGGLQGRTG